MTRGELLDLVIEHTGLEIGEAMSVVTELWAAGAEGMFTPDGIDMVVESLGLKSEPMADEPKTPAPEMSMDPAVVLAEVYRACPRCLVADENGEVHIPRVGRAPKESVFFEPEMREMIDSLPEEIRLLIVSISFEDASATVTLYDEANDIDRKIGPLDLTRFSSQEELQTAMEVLCKRLPRVLAAEWN